MSSHLRKYYPLLKRIVRMGNAARARTIKQCNREQRSDGLFEQVRTNVLKENVPLKKTTVYSLAAQEERPQNTCKYSYVAQEEKSYCTTRRLSGVVTGACSCSAG